MSKPGRPRGSRGYVMNTCLKCKKPCATAGKHYHLKCHPNPGNYYLDMMLCNLCGWRAECDVFRPNAVCGMTGTEMSELAKQFKTRDVSQVIDGLSDLLVIQSNRLMFGLKLEKDEQLLYSDVTKIINTMFINGVRLAKILDPTLTRPNVQVNVGRGGAAAIQTGDTRMVVAAVVKELEAQGVPRDRITPEVLTKALGSVAKEEVVDVPASGSRAGAKSGSRSAAPEDDAGSAPAPAEDDEPDDLPF